MSPDTRISVGGKELNPVRGGILMLIVGVAVAGYGGYDYVQQSDAMANAVEVNATITETDIETVSKRRGGPDYRPEVAYEYRYQGQSYTGTSIYPATVAPDYGTRSEAEAALDEYEVNETVTAYVNSDSPDEAFLENEQSNAPLKFVGIGVLIVLISGGSIFQSL